MALKNKMFLSGEWTFLSIRKTGDREKIEFQLTLADDDLHTACLFRDIHSLEVDGLSRATHLSLQIRRLTDQWPEGMRFEVSDLESDSLNFRCAFVEVDGREF